MNWCGTYILDEQGEPVACEDFLEWALWMGEHNPRVAVDQIGDVMVSTTFLGLDLGSALRKRLDPGTNYPAHLWETMIFGGKYDLSGRRYTTRRDALRGHQRAVKMVSSLPDQSARTR